LLETAIGLERQLFSRTTLGVNFVNSRGNHELRTVDINAPIAESGQLPPDLLPSTAVIRPYGNVGDIYDYQSSGTFKQTQLLLNVNSQVGKWLTLFSRYTYNNAHSDTDGLGTLPSNTYNYAADWGRSSLDIAHNFFLGGSIAAKWGVRFSPFVILHTGTPYNITTGSDLYLMGTGNPTARPTLNSTPAAGVSGAALLPYLNPDPLVGEPEIERNSGTGPGFIGINLSVSKTFGFGTTKFAGQVGGARAGGGGGGGGRGGGGFGGGGPRGMGGGDTTEHRYNLTVRISARDILNHENLSTPIGVMTSPYFAQSTGIAGGFAAETTSAEQRRIELQLRFAF
jgi:hypothetical protein